VRTTANQSSGPRHRRARFVTTGLCTVRDGDKHHVVTRGLPGPVARRLDPEERYGLRVTLFALALVMAGVPFGLLLDQVKRNGPLIEVDTAAANHLHGWVLSHPWAEGVFRVLSFLGSPPWFYLLIGATALFFWFRAGHLRLAAYLVVTGFVGGAVDTAVKVLVDRDRPSLSDPIATAHGQSFPSGHTMLATYGYGALLLAFLPVLPRRTRPWAIGGWLVLVGLIALSRLGLGVHYISDVLGGFVLGLAWLALSTAAFSVWRIERGRKPVELTEGVEPEVKQDIHA
jgi:undecaprenyl-diphosphatase